MNLRIERVANHKPKYAVADDFYVLDESNNIICDDDGDQRIFKLEEAHGYLRDENPVINKSDRDIFHNLKALNIPKTVYIVAPGKNGLDHYRNIPKDAFVIVVNKGIEAPVQANLWMVMDSSSEDKPWFRDNYAQHNQIMCLSQKYGRESAYTFKVGPSIGNYGITLKSGELQSGITIVACAIQLAYFAEAKKIILCGVDLYGGVYFDGEKADYIKRRKDEPWSNILGRMNGLLATLYQKGVLFESLSETELTIPTAPGGVEFLKSGVKFKPDVYIVGTGPRGIEHYKDIPATGATVIVVNAAINIMGIRKDYWLVEDSTIPNKEWFPDAVEWSIRNEMVPAVFVDKTMLNVCHAPYYFNLDGFIGGATNIDCRIVPGKTFGGSTIACRAFQMACQMGAARIHLVGIDMFGTDYYDKTQVDDKFYDIRKDSEWTSQKEGFDKVILWAWDEMGIATYSLSETALEVQETPMTDLKYVQYPMPEVEINDLPTIAYLTMALDPVKTMNALAWCAAQDYPDHLKTQYILYQEPFPEDIIHDVPFHVKQIRVPGTWPALWAQKLWAFLEAAEEDLILVFDEDDCWMPSYTREAIRPLMESDQFDFAWCYDMLWIEKLYCVGDTALFYSKFDKLPKGGVWAPVVQWKRHPSAIGTLVARLEPFRAVCDVLKENHPNGLVKGKKSGQYAGPIDNYLRRLLQNTYKDKLTEHQAKGRWYFVHKKASSKYGRRKEGYIDG